MIYDMHVHSTASDGILSPQEIIAKAIDMGLAGIALTDHDTVDGIATAVSFLKKQSVEFTFIPGVELNTEVDNKEVHILGYFIDITQQEILQKMAEIRQQRKVRADKIVCKLKNLGLKITMDEVNKSAGGDLLGRPHIAQALVHNGEASSVEEVFEKYIAKGRPAYVPRYKFTPLEAIAMVKNAGGIAILAHPGLIRDDRIVENIVEMGVEGLEVNYPEHSMEEKQKYLEIVRKNQLLMTGGSDFHGYGSTGGRSLLGSAGVNEYEIKKIFDYLEERNNKKNK